ncbi:MAG: hypothetical protein U9R08_03830 [Nanoarchaeota archaeon]|nr:hypothetical protein [Nanoarchaeota archaeon]
MTENDEVAQRPAEVVKGLIEETQRKLSMANLEDTQGAAADLIAKVRAEHSDYNNATADQISNTYGNAVTEHFALKNHKRLGYLAQSSEGGSPPMKPEDQKIFEASLNGKRPKAVLKAGIEGLQKGKFNEGITAGTSDLEQMTDMARAYSNSAGIQKGLISSINPDHFKAYMAGEWGVDVASMDNEMYLEALPQLVLTALAGKKPNSYEVLAMTTRQE